MERGREEEQKEKIRKEQREKRGREKKMEREREERRDKEGEMEGERRDLDSLVCVGSDQESLALQQVYMHHWWLYLHERCHRNTAEREEI